MPHLAPPLSLSALETLQQSDIRHFDSSEWNALISRNEPQLRHEVLLAVQSSGLAKNPRYITVRRAGILAGVAIVCDNDIDLLTLAAPKMKHFAAKIRRGPFKRLGILRSQTCGPHITNCRPNMALAADLSEDARVLVARDLVNALDATGKEGLRVIFELDDQNVRDFGPALEACGHVRAASLPGTRINIESDWHELEDYVGAMRKQYRRAVRDDQAKAAGLQIQIEADFADLADEVHALYLNVLERADATFEPLTPAFIREFARCPDSRLVTARLEETGQLVGVELLLVGEDRVQDLYTGVDYRFNESHNIYFNLVYPAIDLACRQSLKFISTGQTSYKFKSRLGIEPFELSIYLKHRNPLVNAVLHKIHPLICPRTPTFEHRVFKREVQHVNTPPKSKIGLQPVA